MTEKTDRKPKYLAIPGDVTEARLEALLAAPAAALRRGELVAFPTETVYGLGAAANSVNAVERVYEVKGRDTTKPLLFHVADITAARALTSAWSSTAQTLANRFLPGPLTLILPAAAALRGHLALAGQAGVGIRIPQQRTALTLLKLAAVPVCAPSANLSGRPSPTRAADVLADLGRCVDWIVDDGPTAVGLESTVLDLCSGPLPVILRPGAVSAERIAACLLEAQDPVTRQPDWFASLQGRASRLGRTKHSVYGRHYVPGTPVCLFSPAELGDGAAAAGQAAMFLVLAAAGIRHAAWFISTETQARLAALAAALPLPPPSAVWPGRQLVFGSREDAEAAARQLYAGLRDLDGEGPDAILVEYGGEAAYRDRLEHAASWRIVAGELLSLESPGARAGGR